jgi:hypothetical protein
MEPSQQVFLRGLRKIVNFRGVLQKIANFRLRTEHKVLVMQPYLKWGRNQFHLETVDHMFGEALNLVT